MLIDDHYDGDGEDDTDENTDDWWWDKETLPVLSDKWQEGPFFVSAGLEKSLQGFPCSHFQKYVLFEKLALPHQDFSYWLSHFH